MTTTTTPAWPTQLLLPGQAAAPEGPVDMIMMYVMHHAFRRDLTAFAAAAAATPVDDQPTWQALNRALGAVRPGAAPPSQRRGRRRCGRC